MNGSEAGRQKNSALNLVFAALAMTLFALSLNAQSQTKAQNEKEDSQTIEATSGGRAYQTLYLNATTREQDARDIVTDIRNMLPKAKVYYIPWQHAISIIGSTEDFTLARKMLLDLDKARGTYRLTYTITENRGGQAVGTRRFALVVVTGDKVSLTQGSRVPVVTSATEGGASGRNAVDYENVGLKIDAFLDGTPGGLRLRTLVQQSSVAEEKSGMGTQDPIIRQTTLDDTSMLVQGKPLVLGTLDTPASSQREQIEVSAELIQ